MKIPDYLPGNSTTMNTQKAQLQGRIAQLERKAEEAGNIIRDVNAEIEAGDYQTEVARAQVEAIAARGRAYLEEIERLREHLSTL